MFKLASIRMSLMMCAIFTLSACADDEDTGQDDQTEAFTQEETESLLEGELLTSLQSATSDVCSEESFDAEECAAALESWIADNAGALKAKIVAAIAERQDKKTSVTIGAWGCSCTITFNDDGSTSSTCGC